MKFAAFFLPALLLLLGGCATTSQQGPVPKEKVVQEQAFLDRHNFGPGKVDGETGEFTAKARDRYQRATGLPPASTMLPPYTTYTVQARDVARIGTIAPTPAEQAKQRSMPYTSVAELVAERYHTTVRFLQKLNPDLSLTSLSAGTVLRVPNVVPFEIENFAARARLPRNPALAGRHITVNTHERMLDVFEGHRLIASFPITPGSSELPAPQGKWRIVGIATMPWYRYDEKVLKEGIRSDKFELIPAGPNSPVGVLWIGLSKPGIGIHGTNNPDTIGRAASHGCIRLANWDAAKMAHLVTVGIPVQID